MKRYEVNQYTVAASGNSVDIDFLMPKEYQKITGIILVPDASKAIPMHGAINLKVDSIEVLPKNFDSMLISATYQISREEAKLKLDLPADGRRVKGTYTDIPNALTAANYPYTFQIVAEYEKQVDSINV